MRWMPVVVWLVAAGCISQGEYDALLKERNDFRDRVAGLEDEVDRQKGRVRELEKKLEEVGDGMPTRPAENQLAAAMSQLELSRGDKIFAKLDTSEGLISCELAPKFAPNAVLNFVGLAEGTKEWTDPVTGKKTVQKLYDGTKFHRVIKGFLIQGGDPVGNGRGGPGYTFANEVWPDVRFDRPGIMAMASTGGVSNGSQFFITDGKQVHLNGQNTIFGLCDIETVRKIMDVETEGPEKATPVKDVILKKVTIERKRRDDE